MRMWTVGHFERGTGHTKIICTTKTLMDYNASMALNEWPMLLLETTFPNCCQKLLHPILIAACILLKTFLIDYTTSTLSPWPRSLMTTNTKANYTGLE